MSSGTPRKRRIKIKDEATLDRAQVKRLLTALGEAQRLIEAVTAELLKSAAPLAKPGAMTWIGSFAERIGGKPCGLEYAEKAGPKPCGIVYATRSGPKPC